MFIAMRPQGVTSFFSSACLDGRVNGMHLTGNSSFLKLALPGDTALAGRALDIEEDVA